MPKAEYKSALRSKRMIADALLKLAEEKPLSKITVTDIVNTAEISRNTFYTHYEDMDDLVRCLEDYAVGETQKLLVEMSSEFSREKVLEIFLAFSDELEKNKRLNTMLFSSDDTRILAKTRKSFVDYASDNDAIPAVIRASPRFTAMAHFYAGGAANMYQAWFRGELGGTLQDIAHILCDTLLQQIENYKKTL